MRRVRAKIEREIGPATDGEKAAALRQRIADEVGVPLRDVELMEARLAGSDFSLNAAQSAEEGQTWLDALEDDAAEGAETVARASDLSAARAWIIDGFEALTERERMIIRRRKLADRPATLERLGGEMGLSKERVRQLEAQALSKMKSRLEAIHGAAPSALAASL